MVLSVENLSFSYERRQILQNLSLSLKSGETLAILGPNGIGIYVFKDYFRTFKSKKRSNPDRWPRSCLS